MQGRFLPAKQPILARGRSESFSGRPGSIPGAPILATPMSTGFATPLGLVLEPREMVARCAEAGLRVELVARPDSVAERRESLGKPLVAEALWGRVRLTRQRNGEVRQNPTYRGDGRRASFGMPAVG